MIYVDLGYGWLCPISWLMTNVGWWGAMLAAHYGGEPGIVFIGLMVAYHGAVSVDVELPRPAYDRFARWEFREADDGSAWKRRRANGTLMAQH